jgi:hypothetical protein
MARVRHQVIAGRSPGGSHPAGGGDPAAVASPSAPMGKSIGEIFDQQAHLGQPWILHRDGGLAQSRVTQLNDGSDGHGQFSIVYRRLALAGFYLVVTAGSDPIEIYLAMAASKRLRNSSFFSAGRNDASKELRASSRRCSSVKPKACCAS